MDKNGIAKLGPDTNFFEIEMFGYFYQRGHKFYLFEQVRPAGLNERLEFSRVVFT